MKHELNPKALAISLALISALMMLLLGIAGNIGIYAGAVEMMKQWHMFFDITILGTIAGMIEAGIISFIFGWLIAYAYNKFV
ncbi:hypothetical protein KKG29_05520 [Patescibacteria group bacterium]|nr:hypothetical protein [Patescibacteria group bacterium]MBU4069752.1 hypothetical protein [Nanoarchaeota archaeon]